MPAQGGEGLGPEGRYTQGEGLGPEGRYTQGGEGVRA